MFQFEDENDLKGFILWCKAEGVQHFQSGNLSFDLSPIVLAPLMDKNAPEPGTDGGPRERAEELSDLYELE